MFSSVSSSSNKYAISNNNEISNNNTFDDEEMELEQIHEAEQEMTKRKILLENKISLKVIFRNIENCPWKFLSPTAQNYKSIREEVLNPTKFLQCDGFKKITLPPAILAVGYIVIPNLLRRGNISILTNAGRTIRIILNEITDTTQYPFTYTDVYGDLIEGTTNNLSRSVALVVAVGIPLLLVSLVIVSKVVEEKVEEKGSINKVLFPFYYTWQVEQLKDIKKRYDIPTYYKELPELKVPGNICEISGELLCFPVISSRGHRFEESVISEWLKDNANCPISNTHLKYSDITFDDITYTRIRDYIFSHSAKQIQTSKYSFK